MQKKKKSWALCKVRWTETTSPVRFLWKGRHYNSRTAKAILLQCQSLVCRMLQLWPLLSSVPLTAERPGPHRFQSSGSCPVPHFEKCNNTKVYHYQLQELSTVLQSLLDLPTSSKNSESSCGPSFLYKSLTALLSQQRASDSKFTKQQLT